MQNTTNLNKFDLRTSTFTKNNLSFLECLYELEDYFAQGYEDFDLISALTGEIVNDYDFIINSPNGSQTYKLSDIFEVIPYFNRFSSITCNQIIGMPLTLWEKT